MTSASTGTAEGATDAQLLAAHVDGDSDAFAELFRRHHDRLWAVAVRTARDREEAADALQEAMISAFRHAASYRGDAAVTTWLHRIVVNACLDRIRRRNARPTDPLPEDDHALDAAEHFRPDEGERRQTQLDVRAALAQLNPDQRAALVLVDMQGYSVEEAAGMLDCAVGTVKSRCARGRAKLAPLLAHLSANGPTEHPDGNRPGADDVASSTTTASPHASGSSSPNPSHPNQSHPNPSHPNQSHSNPSHSNQASGGDM